MDRKETVVREQQPLPIVTILLVLINVKVLPWMPGL